MQYSDPSLNGITSVSNIHYCALSDDTTHTQNTHGQVIFHRPDTWACSSAGGLANTLLMSLKT